MLRHIRIYGIVFINILLANICNGQGYNPTKHIVANDAIGFSQSTPADARSMYWDTTFFKWRDFASTAEVLSTLTNTVNRFGGSPIYVHVGGTLSSGVWIGGTRQIWWFKDGTTNGNLVRWWTDSTIVPNAVVYAKRLTDSTFYVARTDSTRDTVLIRGTAAGGSINSLTLAAPSLLFGTPINFSNGLGAWSGTMTLNNQNPNTFFAGPTSGSPGAPTMRQLVVNDLPINIPNGNLQNTSITFGIGTGGTSPNWSTTSPALGSSTVLNIPLVNSLNTGLTTPTQFGYWNQKVDSITISNDSIYKWANAIRTFQGVVTGGGGGSGTVTNFVFTNGGGIAGVVTNSTTTPTLSLSPSFTGLTFSNGSAFAAATVSSPLTYSAGTLGIQIGNSSQSGAISNTDWNTFNGKLGTTLTSGNIFVGNASNVATGVSATGDWTINNAGVNLIGNNKITYAKIQSASGQALLGTTGAGNYQEITLGTNLSMSGSTLNASGGGSFYQTVQSNSVSLTQQPRLNFSNRFAVTNNSGNTSTDVALANTTVIPGTYTNASITVGADGTLTGASSGSVLTTYWQPETFGAVPDGVTDCTNAIQQAIDSAAVTRGTVLFSKGTYLVRTSYRDTSVVYTPKGLKLHSNITITGQGASSIIKIAAPPPSATFSAISAPLTFSTNTKFYSLFNLDTVTSVVLQNFYINGNIANQINKAPNLDPYANPQDGSTTPNVQTDAIQIISGSNNLIYNVRIDSCVGYGISTYDSKQDEINHITATTCVNGGVYYKVLTTPDQTAGDILHNSLITNNNSDNVRVRASYIFINNNEISFAKRRPPGAGSINFAGLYLESDVGSGILGVNITGNYIHDNSAYGIDQFQADTVLWTYAGHSNLIYNNTINNNGAGGIQIALPYTIVRSNNLWNQGRTSTGFIDSSGSQCKCGIHINGTASLGSEVTSNSFIDTTKIMTGGALSGTPSPRFVFAMNNAKGMSLVNGAAGAYYATAPYNNIYGNSYTDTSGNTHNDLATTSGGALVINPTSGQNGANVQPVFIGDGSIDAQIFLNHLAFNRSAIFGGQSANGSEMSMNIDERGFYGGSNGNINGRSLYFNDMNASLRRLGLGPDGVWYFGTANTTPNWSAKFNPMAALSGNANQTELYAFGSGSAAVAQNALVVTMDAGYTGTGGAAEAARFINKTVANGNSISGAATFAGNISLEAYSQGAATSGVNAGIRGWSFNGLRNVGIIGDATFSQLNNASAQSIGVIGYALKNTTGVNIGGYFGLHSSQPTFTSAALIANNGATSDPIARFQVNNVDKIIFDNAGKVDLLNLSSSGANDSVLTVDPVTHQINWRSGIFNLFFANGLITAAGDSVYLGGTLNQNTTINSAGFDFKITNLPNKTPVSTDSALIEDNTGKIWKAPFTTLVSLGTITATGSTAPGANIAESIVYVDATSGNITLTIIFAATNQVVHVKRKDSSGNTVTLQLNTGNIDGSATKTVSTLGSANLIWDGTNGWLL